LVEEQVGALKNQRIQQGILADAIRQASAMPTVAETVTTNQQLKYPDDVQVTEPAPASVVPPRYSEINKAPQMYEDLMSQVQALRSTGGNVPGMPSLSAPNYGLASLAPKPISLPNARPSVPVEAPAQQMITKTVPAQGPPELITEKKVSSSPITYADTRAQLMKYLSEKGADAATLSSVDSILHAAGFQPPIQAQSLSIPGGTIVRVGNQDHILPVNQEAQRHLISTSIDIPGEVTAQFRTTQDREKFSEDLTTYKQINTSVNNLNSIIDKYPGFSGKIVRSLSPTVGAEISTNLDTLKSHLNKPITGGGNLSDTDYKRINEVIRDPSKFFTMDSATKTKLLGLSKTAKSKLENQFKATTVQGSLNLGGPQPYNQGGAMKTLKYNPVTKSME
jgi:hypothetical protein